MIGGISIWQLLIVLVIILVLFGTKKLRSLGSDLGGAVQGFKKSLKDDGQQDDQVADDDAAQPELDPMAEEVATAAKQTADQQKTS